MKSGIGITLAAALAVATLGGCGHMSRTERNTATGAAIGGIGGAAVTGGSRAGAVGGAVAGGIVGHEWENRNK
jgi:osmotically inducible lipoprotein OsmB